MLWDSQIVLPNIARTAAGVNLSFSPVHVRSGSWLFSNSGREVKLSLNVLAGSMVLSAVGACPPHDGVR